MSPITQAFAVGAGDALAAAATSASCRDMPETTARALRTRETIFHNTGVCLISRLLRRCTLDNARAGRPRHFVVAV
jgi:hypothetical protein